MAIPEIRPAELSPRIEKGVILWYYLDTFDVTLTMELTDTDGTEITLSGSDTVDVCVLDSNYTLIPNTDGAAYTFHYTVSDLEEDGKSFKMQFVSSASGTTQIATSKFGRGKYTYDVYVTHAGYRTTIVNDREMVVE